MMRVCSQYCGTFFTTIDHEAKYKTKCDCKYTETSVISFHTQYGIPMIQEALAFSNLFVVGYLVILK